MYNNGISNGTINKSVCPNIPRENAGRLSDTLTESGLTDSLLELEEEYIENDACMTQSISYEMAETLCAWQDVAPNVHIVVPRKKRVPAKSADEVHVRRIKMDELHKYQKKAVESIFTTAAIWRQCVEPTTYRYIPNNGRYRVSKLEHKPDRDSKIARTIRSMEKLNPEQRHLQKEIQRELRQEFEVQQRLERQAEQKQRLKAAEVRRLEYQAQARGDQRDYMNEEQYKVHGAIVQRKVFKDPLFHRRVKTPVELPPINVPLVGRAMQDTYMDSFNIRIHNLEKEMERDQMLLRKQQQQQDIQDEAFNNTRVVVRAKAEPVNNPNYQYSNPPNSNGKTSHYMDFSGLPLFVEPVTEECLSVKPIVSKGKQKYSSYNNDTSKDLIDNKNRDSVSSIRSTRTLPDDENIKTVFIKYTNSRGDVVKIPKYSSSTPISSATSNINPDQPLVLKRSNQSLNTTNNKTVKADKDSSNNSHANSSNGPNLVKYTPRGVNKKILVSSGVFIQDEEPPVIVAEGLFSRTKDGVKPDNVQVTVTKRKKDKTFESIPSPFVPGVAGKNCELPQRT